MNGCRNPEVDEGCTNSKAVLLFGIKTGRRTRATQRSLRPIPCARLNSVKYVTAPAPRIRFASVERPGCRRRATTLFARRLVPCESPSPKEIRSQDAESPTTIGSSRLCQPFSLNDWPSTTRNVRDATSVARMTAPNDKSRQRTVPASGRRELNEFVSTGVQRRLRRDLDSRFDHRASPRQNRRARPTRLFSRCELKSATGRIRFATQRRTPGNVIALHVGYRIDDHPLFNPVSVL